MAWRKRDDASTSAIGFAVAAGLFAISFTAANLMVEKPASTDLYHTELNTAATSALDVIVSQGGRTASGTPWAPSPDVMQRFGLGTDARENFLDYVKIKSMRNGTMTHATNNAPDYPDVRAALGMTTGDFHLRTYPVIPGLDDPRWTKDPRGRMAYVGHIDSAQGSASIATYANTSGSILNVSIAVRNDGTADHIFVANVGLGKSATDSVLFTEQRHTRLLAPGEVQTLWIEFPKMAYASGSVTGVKVQMSDGYGEIVIPAAWTAATAPSSGSNAPWAPLASAGRTYFVSGEPVKFILDHAEADGTRMNNAQSAHLVLVGPNGKVWLNTSATSALSLPKNKALTWECANCTAVGNYTATLWDTAFTRRAMDTVHVSAAEMFLQTEALTAVATKEVGFLKDLVQNFNGRLNTDADPDGDVFTDAEHLRDLDSIIARYSFLVVGSEVRQNALNNGQTKWAIADWVQAGGNLIVVGTLDSQSHWLEPVYHAAQQTANGGIGAPDPTHPMLVTPNRLDYQRYLDNGRAWNIKDDQPFTHVLTRGASGSSSDDTIAIAAPGAYNDGSVVLTSYMPGALTTPQDDMEAKRFLHNMISQSYNMLFLDFGPPVPEKTPVGSAQRLTAVPHPNVPGAVVEVKILMYVWS